MTLVTGNIVTDKNWVFCIFQVFIKIIVKISNRTNSFAPIIPFSSFMFVNLC